MSDFKQRILMVTRSLPCHVAGGLEHHVQDLAVRLAVEGARVDILTAAVPPEYRQALSVRGIGVIAMEGCPPGAYSLAWLRGAGPMIARLCRERDYRIIHGHEFAFGFMKMPLAGTAARCVLTVHGTITSETPLHPDVYERLDAAGRRRAWLRFGRRYLFRRSWHEHLDHADGIFVDSEYTLRELETIRPGAVGKARRVPLCLEMEQYPEIERASARAELGWRDAPDAPPRLITVGRLTWQKGHAVALDALARIRDLPWRYMIVGEGEEEVALKRQALRLGISDRVDFAGRASARRKVLMLAASDLFVWPERTHPAFGLVGLESLVCGTPVAAARRGAIPELIDERAGVLFEPENAAEIESALRGLIADPARLGSMRAGLRERTLERFNPREMVSRAVKAYREILERGRPGG